MPKTQLTNPPDGGPACVGRVFRRSGPSRRPVLSMDLRLAGSRKPSEGSVTNDSTSNKKLF